MQPVPTAEAAPVLPSPEAETQTGGLLSLLLVGGGLALVAGGTFVYWRRRR